MFGKKKKQQQPQEVSKAMKDFIASAKPVHDPVDDILRRGSSDKKKDYPFVPTTARGIDYMVEMRIREWVIKNGGEGTHRPPAP